MISAIVFLPLIGAIISGLFSQNISHRNAQYVTTSLLFISAILSWIVFFNILSGNSYSVSLLEWLQIDRLQVMWKLRVDSLTAVMLVVVTSVSAVVHMYSIGYMSHDPHIPRFMAYLSLFTFCMLMLVTADNLLQLFFGWEGVGLCSYLLIGFWYKKPSANAAAMKAFIVNRVGDLGFILGVATLFMIFSTIQFDEIFAAIPQYRDMVLTLFGKEYHALTVIAVLLFIGSMGKSAQIGLHTWLPDAMEGPTPVSALIHAATMVTAGVFLVARCSPIFEQSVFALQMVTIVGGVTCLFAATIALTQNDIKKIIAYSTCSQLGYMFFACGVSAYSAGIFHLMTHAFFKALLFLGAGSVIHALSNEQDIRYMGGVWRKIPVTYLYMWIGSLALAGIYPFAGFFSKDIILEAAYASHSTTGQFAFWLGIIAAFLTAFYSWRLIILVFHGPSRASPEVQSHIHESSAVMLVPLVMLALGSVAAGMIGVKLGMIDPEGHFWKGALTILEEHNTIEAAHHVPTWVKWLPLLMGLSGILMAYVCYVISPTLPETVSRFFKPLYILFSRKYFFDEIYDMFLVRPTKFIGIILWKIIDMRLVDGIPNGAAGMNVLLSKIITKYQTGYVYHYAFIMMLGVVSMLSWYIWQYGF